MDLRNRPPTAGEQRDIPLGQALFFSPLPLPTAQGDGLDINGSFLEVNDVYLDIGTSNSGKEFQVQMYTSALSFFCFVCLVLLFTAGLREFYRDEQVYSYWFYLQQVLRDDFTDTLLFIILGVLLLSAYAILSTTYQKLRLRPMRFNRQRREVCYFPPGSDTPVICSWEQLIAWIASSTGTTGSNIMTTYTFGMAIENKANDQYWFIRRPVINVLSAQAEWEAIRDFMEKGPEACPGKAEHIDRHSFDNKRAELHHRFKHGPKYWFNFSMIEWSTSYFGVAWFYIWNVMCWWKFPYYVAEWDLRFSMKDMPINIEAWSSALPEDEWAKPSEELIEQTQKMEAHLARGGLFYDFFATNTQYPRHRK